MAGFRRAGHIYGYVIITISHYPYFWLVLVIIEHLPKVGIKLL